MKIMFRMATGQFAAMDASAIITVPQADDDKWCVKVHGIGFDGWDDVARDLTKVEAEQIVRQLFETGVYGV